MNSGSKALRRNVGAILVCFLDIRNRYMTLRARRYKGTHRSTGFAPLPAWTAPLDPALYPLVDEAYPFYAALHRHALCRHQLDRSTRNKQKYIHIHVACRFEGWRVRRSNRQAWSPHYPMHATPASSFGWAVIWCLAMRPLCPSLTRRCRFAAVFSYASLTDWHPGWRRGVGGVARVQRAPASLRRAYFAPFGICAVHGFL